MSSVTFLSVSEQDHNVRLDRWLQQKLPHATRAHIFKIIREGQVRVNGKRAKPDQRLCAHDQIRIPPLPSPKASQKNPQRAWADKDRGWIQTIIVGDAKDFLAINKPYGLATQRGSGVRQAVADYLPLLDQHLGLTPKDNPTESFCRLVHRLDRDTSGVLLIAKNRSAATWLGHMFKEGSVQKIYIAIVWGHITQGGGLIKRPLVIDGKEVTAETRYEVLNRGKWKGQAVSLLKLMPQTGRKHQLRRHCHMKEFPIVGDQKYDIPKFRPLNKEKQLQLHAWKINGQDPQGEVFLFEAPLPTHMQDTFDELKWKLP